MMHHVIAFIEKLNRSERSEESWTERVDKIEEKVDAVSEEVKQSRPEIERLRALVMAMRDK